MKCRPYELLLLLAVFCIGSTATAEAFLRLDSAAFGTGVFLGRDDLLDPAQHCNFRDPLPIIQDGVPGADQTRIDRLGTERGRASALPFSLGALADNLGAVPLANGQPFIGATRVCAEAVAGAGLRFSGNLVALGSGIPASFEVTGHVNGIESVFGIPDHPNTARNVPVLVLDIRDFYGRFLAFLFIDLVPEVDDTNTSFTGRTRMRAYSESDFYKPDGTFDHAVRIGDCTNRESDHTCLPWTGSYNVPFTIPVFYDSSGFRSPKA